jgi:RimJ/RimL family protein N-acetyltransferase
MRATRSEIESEVLGRNVLYLESWDPSEDFARLEAEFVSSFDPCYVVTKVDATDVAGCHALEDHGFRFLEVQVGLVTTIKKDYGANRYPFSYEAVADEATLEAAKRVAAESLVHDRFRTDPFIGPTFAELRHRAWIQKSYEAQDENVFVLRGIGTGEVVGVKTNRRSAPDEALLLLGAVAAKHQQAGIGAVLDYCELEGLYSQGVRKVHAHVSARNHPIINLEVRGLGFRVVTTQVVLRKVYER